MKTIGLIGGITPESTILYYQILNNLAAKQFGDNHSCKLIINSVDFSEISNLQKQNRWDLLGIMMSDAAKSLELAGASCIIICANTMHITIDAVRSAVRIPVIHVSNATAEKIVEQGLKNVALIGTKYTMELDFFKDILNSYGIATIIPEADDRDIIHDIIYKELSKGIVSDASKQIYLQIVEKLIGNGAEGIILGCTEIPLLINQKDVSVPVFDTTSIHANNAFNTALNM